MGWSLRRPRSEVAYRLDGPQHACHERAGHRHHGDRLDQLLVDAARGISRVRSRDGARLCRLSRGHARGGGGGYLPEGRGGLPERRRHQEDHQCRPRGDGLLPLRDERQRSGTAAGRQRDPFGGGADSDVPGTRRGREGRAGHAPHAGDQGRRARAARHRQRRALGTRNPRGGGEGAGRPARPAHGLGGQHRRRQGLRDHDRDLGRHAAEVRPHAQGRGRHRPPRESRTARRHDPQ